MEDIGEKNKWYPLSSDPGKSHDWRETKGREIADPSLPPSLPPSCCPTELVCLFVCLLLRGIWIPSSCSCCSTELIKGYLVCRLTLLIIYFQQVKLMIFLRFFSRIEPIEVDPCGMVFKGRPLVWSMSGVVGIGGWVFVKPPPAERKRGKENKIAWWAHHPL